MDEPKLPDVSDVSVSEETVTLKAEIATAQASCQRLAKENEQLKLGYARIEAELIKSKQDVELLTLAESAAVARLREAEDSKQRLAAELQSSSTTFAQREVAVQSELNRLRHSEEEALRVAQENREAAVAASRHAATVENLRTKLSEMERIQQVQQRQSAKANRLEGLVAEYERFLLTDACGPCRHNFHSRGEPNTDPTLYPTLNEVAIKQWDNLSVETFNRILEIQSIFADLDQKLQFYRKLCCYTLPAPVREDLHLTNGFSEPSFDKQDPNCIRGSSIEVLRRHYPQVLGGPDQLRLFRRALVELRRCHSAQAYDDAPQWLNHLITVLDLKKTGRIAVSINGLEKSGKSQLASLLAAMAVGLVGKKRVTVRPVEYTFEYRRGLSQPVFFFADTALEVDMQKQRYDASGDGGKHEAEMRRFLQARMDELLKNPDGSLKTGNVGVSSAKLYVKVLHSVTDLMFTFVLLDQIGLHNNADVDPEFAKAVETIQSEFRVDYPHAVNIVVERCKVRHEDASSLSLLERLDPKFAAHILVYTYLDAIVDKAGENDVQVEETIQTAVRCSQQRGHQLFFVAMDKLNSDTTDIIGSVRQSTVHHAKFLPEVVPFADPIALRRAVHEAMSRQCSCVAAEVLLQATTLNDVITDRLSHFSRRKPRSLQALVHEVASAYTAHWPVFIKGRDDVALRSASRKFNFYPDIYVDVSDPHLGSIKEAVRDTVMKFPGKLPTPGLQMDLALEDWMDENGMKFLQNFDTLSQQQRAGEASSDTNTHIVGFPSQAVQMLVDQLFCAARRSDIEVVRPEVLERYVGSLGPAMMYGMEGVLRLVTLILRTQWAAFLKYMISVITAQLKRLVSIAVVDLVAVPPPQWYKLGSNPVVTQAAPLSAFVALLHSGIDEALAEFEASQLQLISQFTATIYDQEQPISTAGAITSCKEKALSNDNGTDGSETSQDCASALHADRRGGFMEQHTVPTATVNQNTDNREVHRRRIKYAYQSHHFQLCDKLRVTILDFLREWFIRADSPLINRVFKNVTTSFVCRFQFTSMGDESEGREKSQRTVVVDIEEEQLQKALQIRYDYENHDAINVALYQALR